MNIKKIIKDIKAKKQSDYTAVTFRIDKNTAQKFKKSCRKEGVSQVKVINAFIKQWLINN